MAWHFDLPLAFTSGGFQAQAVEQLLDFGAGHFHAQHLGQALGTQGDRLDLRQVRFAGDVNHWAGFAADDFQQQASGALDGFAGQLRVDTTLVAG
ncbi:hypothetical protein D3C84_1156680 [compost metagenome]